MVAKVETTKVPKLLKRRTPRSSTRMSLAQNGSAQNGDVPVTVTDAALANDPFYYGWRVVIGEEPDGKDTVDWLPLSQADFLDPQLGDQMVQSNLHYKCVKSLFDVYENRYADDPTTGIMSDVKMLWRIPGLSEPAPDLAVIPNMTTKEEYHSSFNVVREGTRPCLVVEVVSPKYTGDDTTKVDIYERAGIQEYIIYDPCFEDEEAPAELIGYRLVNGFYQLMVPGGQGRLYSATTDVWFGLDEDQRRLVLTDGTTGMRLLDNREEHERRILAEQRADAEAARANEEAARANEAEAEIVRLRALVAKSSGKDEGS